MGRHKLIEDDQLLARAREIFVREGINVSGRRIAKEIGVSDSVLFQRFGSMENLLFAAMSPPAPDLSTLLQNDAPRGHVYAHLEQCAVGLFEYFRKLVPVLVPLATHPSFRFDDFRKRHPNSPLEKLTAELMTVWEKKRKIGEIDCPDVGSLILELMAVAYGLAMFEWIGVHDGGFSQSTVRELARVLWRGIAPADQREPQRRARTRAAHVNAARRER
ncbi:MAG TPA: helix-turn-helix domain-containing protein [Polyangiaceae bacterium]|nr:helix-turn-helix domain-containing protein [Polyangiaceae bacterium]